MALLYDVECIYAAYFLRKLIFSQIPLQSHYHYIKCYASDKPTVAGQNKYDPRYVVGCNRWLTGGDTWFLSYFNSDICFIFDSTSLLEN